MPFAESRPCPEATNCSDVYPTLTSPRSGLHCRQPQRVVGVSLVQKSHCIFHRLHGEQNTICYCGHILKACHRFTIRHPHTAQAGTSQGAARRPGGSQAFRNHEQSTRRAPGRAGRWVWWQTAGATAAGLTALSLSAHVLGPQLTLGTLGVSCP